MCSFWQLLVRIRVDYCADFLNIGQQNETAWKDFNTDIFSDWTDKHNYRVQNRRLIL